jgi:hypothetical protein
MDISYNIEWKNAEVMYTYMVEKNILQLQDTGLFGKDGEEVKTERYKGIFICISIILFS